MTDSSQLRPVLFLSLLAGIWYLLTLAPSILFFDSPEFVNTAFALGISHPAGFPFYNMAAKAIESAHLHAELRSRSGPSLSERALGVHGQVRSAGLFRFDGCHDGRPERAARQPVHW